MDPVNDIQMNSTENTIELKKNEIDMKNKICDDESNSKQKDFSNEEESCQTLENEDLEEQILLDDKQSMAACAAIPEDNSQTGLQKLLNKQKM